MSGVGLRWGFEYEAELQQHVNRMLHLDKRGLLDAVGAEVESQVRRRISTEKAGPDGKPWVAWSERYAATRHAGQSLLQSEGHLLDSITYVVAIDGSHVDVGSNLVYAAIQNFGGAKVGKPNLPPRPYLGFSTENREDLRSVITKWLEENWMGGLAA